MAAVALKLLVRMIVMGNLMVACRRSKHRRHWKYAVAPMVAQQSKLANSASTVLSTARARSITDLPDVIFSPLPNKRALERIKITMHFNHHRCRAPARIWRSPQVVTCRRPPWPCSPSLRALHRHSRLLYRPVTHPRKHPEANDKQQPRLRLGNWIGGRHQIERRIGWKRFAI